ncbi:MAG TPA: PAS domain S-box protein [Candidatus Eisenbacteria bacterium]|uniref:histidine kinase n=1 Tax=Eiseniibacteriota bacterium TaxID=2212470 RepID=A0A7V2ATP7_UNCEI|nr:PAS domain S-box protein [Candidatus Eisenbacteria bacterium]
MARRQHGCRRTRAVCGPRQVGGILQQDVKNSDRLPVEEPDSRRESHGEKQQLAAVMEIAHAINSQPDLEHILSTISSELSKVIDFDIGCVAIYEKDQNGLFIRHVSRRNGDNSGEGLYVPFDESNLVGWVAINRKPFLRKNIPADSRFREIMSEEGLKSDLVVPLVAKEALIGTVNIGSYEYDHFTGFDLELAVRFSKLTSIAIENFQLLKSLKDLGERYRLLMNNANDVILLLDSSGEIVECNQMTFKTFGYSPDEVLGKEFSLFTVPGRSDEAKKRFIDILRGSNPGGVEVPYLKKNGELIYLEARSTVITINKNPFILVIGHDITDRKTLEQKITVQNKELKAINKQLRELDQLKSDFLGRISHELRTPLSVIMAYSGTLLEDDGEEVDGETREEFLRVIQSQSNKLLSLINDLLDLSKVEIYETMLDMGEGSLNEIVSIAVKVIEPVATRKQIALKMILDDSLPIVTFDHQRIRQVCINLLNNALKFSGRGGKVFITTKQDGDEVIVSVRDSGPGIDKDDIPDIFENFTQIDGGDTRSKDGLGIGLRLVKHYIDLHKGRIWVESERGKGSRFCFSLPVDRDRNVPRG